MTDQFNLSDVLGKYISKPSEATKPEYAVLYSRPGGGKSYLAATASEIPGVRKTLILDTEGSTVGTLADFDDDKVDIIRITGIEMFNAIIEKLLDPAYTHEYDVVIIDTFDVAQGWAINYYMDNAPITRSGAPDTQKAWGQIGQWSNETVGQRLRHAPFFVIAVIHEKEEKDADGAIFKGLNLKGNAKVEWPGIPDMVAYLERKIIDGEPRTVAYFDTDDNKVTKNRFHFPSKVLDPTFPKLFEFIDKRKADKKEDK